MLGETVGRANKANHLGSSGDSRGWKGHLHLNDDLHSHVRLRGGCVRVLGRERQELTGSLQNEGRTLQGVYFLYPTSGRLM